MLAVVMSLYVFGKENINSYIRVNHILTTVVFILVISLIGMASFLVMCREHRYLLLIDARLQALYTKARVERFPEDNLKLLLKLERFLSDKVSIATVLSISTIAISFFVLH